MKRIGELLTAVVCTAALVLSFGSFTEKRVAATNPLAVNVTNTPLPTKAAQNGTWTVGITGTPTVGISGTPSVTVGNSSNSPVNVVDVSVAAREPFETTLCSTDNDPDCPTFNTSSTYAVPLHQRLTVEYVSGSCFSTPSTSQVYDFSISDNLVDHHFVPVEIASTGTARLQSVAQETHLYYGPGSLVHVFITTSTGTKILCTASLSGYLQPAP